MAAEVSKDAYDEMMNISKSLMETLMEIFSNFAKKFEADARFAPQKALARWIKTGGELCSYKVIGDCTEELKETLRKEGIAFVGISNSDSKYDQLIRKVENDLKGFEVGSPEYEKTKKTLENIKREREKSQINRTNTILIKVPDIERVKTINRQILHARSNFALITSKEELETAIASVGGLTDRRIFEVKDLNKYQANVLINKCNHIVSNNMAGFTVGMTKNDNDKYNIVFHAPKLYSSEGNMDFCKAYLAATLSLYGPNFDIKKQQLDADEKIDTEIEKLYGSDDVHYIIGVDDTTKFIEINGNDFQYYTTRVVDGKRTDSLVESCPKDDHDYFMRLQKCLALIQNKAIVSPDELTEHLSVKKRNMDTERPEKNEREYYNACASNILADGIDILVKDKISKEKMSFQSDEGLFTYYQKEASKIIEAFSHSEIPAGYSKEAVEALYNQINDNTAGGRFDREQFASASPYLTNVICNTHQAKEYSQGKVERTRNEDGFTNR